MSHRFRIVYVCRDCGREARLGIIQGEWVVICDFDEWWESVGTEKP